MPNHFCHRYLNLNKHIYPIIIVRQINPKGLDPLNITVKAFKSWK